MPRYLLLLHDAGTMPEGIGPDEIQAIIQRYVNVAEEGRGRRSRRDGPQAARQRGPGDALGQRTGERDRRPVRRGARGRRRAVRRRRRQLRRGAGAVRGLPAPRLRHHRDPRDPTDLGPGCRNRARWLRDRHGDRTSDGRARRSALPPPVGPARGRAHAPARLAPALAGRGRGAGRAGQGAADLAARRRPRQPRRRGCTRWPAGRRSIGCATNASSRPRPMRWPRTASSADARCPSTPAPFDDDELVMMFMTCHPALTPDARVALTLKVVGGFGVGEIARAFLMQEPAVAQRLVRAKRTLREHDLPFALPAATDVGERLASVLDALYLMFSEGHATDRRAAGAEGGRRRRGDAAGHAAVAPPRDGAARDPRAAGADAAARRALSRGGSTAARCGCSPRRTARRGTACCWPRACARSIAPPPARSRAASTSKRRSPRRTPPRPTWADTDWPHILVALRRAGRRAGRRRWRR